jgi:tRNA (guanosine-2'-O-)-methyltransferase
VQRRIGAAVSWWAFGLTACGAAVPEAVATRTNEVPQPAGERGGTTASQFEVACLPSGPEVCYNAADDNCNGLIDEGCGTPSALVHIALSWREPDVDVDLDVTSPDGELVEVDKPLQNGLVKLRDCPGDDDDCRGTNSEHVLLQPEHAVPVGTYRVTVRLEAINGAEPPIRVHLSGRLGPRSYASEFDLSSETAERTLSWEL